MENPKQILEEIGLNHFESKLYLELLYRGELPASKLATFTQIPRTTTRGILDKLCERGVLRKIYKRNTQYYSCKKPEQLLTDLEHSIKEKEAKLERAKKAIPLLNSFYQNRGIAPKVQVFEGTEQVIEAFNRSLYEDSTKELIIFTSYEFLKTPIIKKNDDKFFIRERVKRGIPARVLVGKTDASSKMTLSSPKELRERRFIPEKFKIPGNIHIYGDSVLYFSTKEKEFMAVLIQGAMMADTMKTLFEFMWEACET